ncbi:MULTISPECIES: DUF2207 domain-containing protein [unclassified Luteococcus]|uniref:DUF2207 domain-containing protein n=1 Tax=unclassified Luteococcus TaxID=2639923 RepID=UPI00313F0362
MTTLSKRVVWLAITLLLALGLGATGGRPASAAPGDSIRTLAVSYTIRPDGLVDMDYRVDYHFGEPGRHGISFTILTGEVWGADRSKLALYELSGLQVTDADGEKVPFTSQTETASDGASRRALKIGDPNKTIEGQEASYRIRYTAKGALRTFDGQPEFYWDVTSNEIPTIESYQVTIKAPGALSGPKCSASQCRTTAKGSSVTFSGSDHYQGTALTVAALIAKGSVNNAVPTLVDRTFDYPTALAAQTDIKLAATGSATVTHTATVSSSGDYGNVILQVPNRIAYDTQRDQVFRVDQVRASVDGEPVEVGQQPAYGAEPSWAEEQISVTVPAGTRARTMVLSYRVQGASVRDGDRVRFSWPAAALSLEDDARSSYRLTAPGPVQRAECVSRMLHRDAECHSMEDKPTVAGPTVTLARGPGWDGDFLDVWLPATAVPGADQSALQPSEQLREATHGHWLVSGVVGAFLATVIIPMLGRLVGRKPDQRFAGVAPGIIPDGTPQETDDDNPQIPVAFTPPELSLSEAAALLDDKYHPRHLAAVLTRMAVDGLITLESDPLLVRRTGAAVREASPLEARILLDAADPSATSMGTVGDAAQSMADEVRSHVSRFRHPSLFQPVRSGWTVPLGSVLVLLGGTLAAAWLLLPTWGVARSAVLAVAGVLGSIIGLTFQRAGVTKYRRTGLGTARHDQLIGFKNYLTTAEAGQIRFEEEQDIFNRYLPWAVLFDVADRWVRVCREAAAAGRTQPPENAVPWLMGDLDGLGRLEASIADAMPRTSSSSSSSSSSGSSWSSGDSGSSSSSSSFSSGGGGGGTSIDSW